MFQIRSFREREREKKLFLLFSKITTHRYCRLFKRLIASGTWPFSLLFDKSNVCIFGSCPIPAGIWPEILLFCNNLLSPLATNQPWFSRNFFHNKKCFKFYLHRNRNRRQTSKTKSQHYIKARIFFFKSKDVSNFNLHKTKSLKHYNPGHKKQSYATKSMKCIQDYFPEAKHKLTKTYSCRRFVRLAITPDNDPDKPWLGAPL